MKKQYRHIVLLLLISVSFCTQKPNHPSATLIKGMNLKRGAVISCGPMDKAFGSLAFEYAGNAEVREDVNLAVKLLHSFEYDEAEKVFAGIIDKHPECAIAYWGVAMANFHPLWAPPEQRELEKGAAAVEIGQSIGKKSEKEAGYLSAIGRFYNGWHHLDHRTRTLRFEKAMEMLHEKYPKDKEVTVFYALSLTAAADPKDKTYQKQKKAGRLLNSLYPDEPNHPGIAHYLIHAYDYPELATLGLPAARKYASIAPSSAHALHMPSHIFTRLGLWDECIQSNLASVENAKCYAQQAGIKGHWDEELHGLDYLTYAYLQKGDNAAAQKQWDYLKTMTEVSPVNFKVAYSSAAIPSRILLENRRWKEAADLELPSSLINWANYPWEKAILHFTRLIGSVQTGALPKAKTEYNELTALRDQLLQRKNNFQADKVEVQRLAGMGWIVLKEGKSDEAIRLLQDAADLEDKTEKHPVTPGDVLPAREQLGDLLLQLGRAEQALMEYEASLKKTPNRLNGLYGAGSAAEKTGNSGKAVNYYRQLLKIVGDTKSNRPELKAATDFLNHYNLNGVVAKNSHTRL